MTDRAIAEEDWKDGQKWQSKLRDEAKIKQTEYLDNKFFGMRIQIQVDFGPLPIILSLTLIQFKL